MKVKVKEDVLKDFNPVKLTLETQIEFDMIMSLLGGTHQEIEHAFTGERYSTVLYDMYSKLDKLDVQNEVVELNIDLI